jgi:hypothetical protein
MNMPQMPGVAQSNEKAQDASPVAPSVLLNVPSHIEEDLFQKPILDTVENKNASNVVVPLVPKNGIEVEATRIGFYNQMRIREGDKFLVRKFEDLGEWMKCVDPALEKKRLEFFKLKKAKK